jgi:hypothetical protein
MQHLLFFTNAVSLKADDHIQHGGVYHLTIAQEGKAVISGACFLDFKDGFAAKGSGNKFVSYWVEKAAHFSNTHNQAPADGGAKTILRLLNVKVTYCFWPCAPYTLHPTTPRVPHTHTHTVVNSAYHPPLHHAHDMHKADV